MRYFSIALLLAGFSFAEAQFTVQSSSPANNSTNVPLTTSLSITFSSALDTTYQLGEDKGIFWNIPTASPGYYSADRKTITFDIVLSPERVYVAAVLSARAEGGASLQSPYPLVFTTGSSFPPYTVSGNVLGGTTGVSPANALVILSSTPISDGGPNAVSGTIADGAGAFTLPYLANGTYYPVAAKDVDGDGSINPGTGDVIALGNPVTINNGDLTGVNLTFVSIGPISLAEALVVADSISATLPPDKSLRQVISWEVDTSGNAGNWEFIYLRDSGIQGYKIRVGSIDQQTEPLDSMSAWWLHYSRTLYNPGSAADPSVFIANVENNGGREFRTQNPGGNLEFMSEVALGDLRWSQFSWLVPDTSLNYWGAAYSWGYDSSDHWNRLYTKNFIGDYTNGNILVVTDAGAKDKATLPENITLLQNYPNPFNPSTMIHFSLPHEEWTTLKVYNLVGQEVATLIQGLVPAGEYSIRFDAENLSSGMYFCRLVAGEQTVTHKMMLMR